MKRSLFIFLFLLVYCRVMAQNWDIELLRHINLDRPRSLDGFFLVVTNWAAPLAYSIPAILLVRSRIIRDRLLQEQSIFMITSGLSVLLFVTLLKLIVNRPRPFVVYPFLQKLTTGGSGSFPSGHTADAFTLAASLSIVFPRWYVVAPAFAWATLVGYSRMDLGVHYPSDVFASVLIGVLFAAVISRFFPFTKAKAEQSVHQ
jgi:undecaprenyl-diphosphatase